MQRLTKFAFTLAAVFAVAVFAINTAHAAQTYTSVGNGGTGTTTAPTYGQLLIGDGSGKYTLMATSSLGIVSGGSSDSWTHPSAGKSATTSTMLFNGGQTGFGTSTPWGYVSINPNNVGSGMPEFVIGSSSATHFVVDGVGSVAIGTTTAPASLTVEGDYSASGIPIMQFTRTGVSASSAYFRFSNGTNAAGQFLPIFDGVSNWISGGGSTGLYFLGRPAQDLSPLDVGVRFDVRTAANTAVTNATIAAFSVFNVNKVVILANGKTGIGTSTPMVNLDIASTSASAMANGGWGQLSLTDTAAAANKKHLLFSYMKGLFTLGTTTDLYATTSPALTINSNGWTGIATSSPGALFSVGNVFNVPSTGISTLASPLNVTGSYSQSSGTANITTVLPTFTQSGTAGYAALIVKPTETTTGSGAKSLIQAGTSTAPNLFTLDNWGIVNRSGVTPTVTGCGTSPTISATSTDERGVINIGSGAVTSCNITFRATHTDTPACVVSTNSTSAFGAITAASSSGVALGFSASVGSGAVNYICNW